MTNFANFKSYVQKYGFSINNFYDVYFEINPSSPLYQELVDRSVLDNRGTSAGVDKFTNLMRLYTDETSLPGIQMSTGEYRINNTPQLKYVYGSVFSESTFSFIMDADSIIKNVFDIWTSWMYSYAISGADKRFRTRYRDDYAIDIVVVKYERSSSSNANNAFARRKADAFSVNQIIPSLSNRPGPSKFYKAVPVYAVRMFKAFPSNVSSVALNSGTSELTKLSVSFDYETIISSPISGNASVDGNVIDPVNGGAATLFTDQNTQIPFITTDLGFNLYDSLVN